MLCAGTEVEERQVDREPQVLPLSVGEPEAIEPAHVPGNALEPCALLGAEEHGAGTACAHEPACSRLEKMIVLGSQLEAAQVATLDRRPRTSEPPEDIERPLRAGLTE